MSETRWLSPDEQRTWRAYLTAHRLLLDEIDAQLRRDSGIPHAYYEILVRLSETPGRTLRMSVLAEGTRVSASRLSHAITRLEERGWVRREDCPTDRRGQLAVLTDDGFAALAAAAPGHVEAVRRALFDALDAEQVQSLGTISRILADHLDATGGETGPPEA
ncbi:MarR family transcriptional regulator [Actinoallomurus liliacearum]|uniref:MarR family transcriptional regulator n=1 Tax=Actinoallomurus liliacearum TaxID=1080073 RepID=A0ABP8TW48_9ACTN